MTPPDTDIPYDLLMAIQRGTMAYRYRGLPLQKNPFDLALYTMLMDQLRPRTLIEIGSFKGGSAVWFTDQARLLDTDMRVISVDLDPPAAIAAPSVQFVRGDARDLSSALPASLMEKIARPLLVVEDSSHLATTTAAVLDFVDPWMRAGEYIVVEDGILSDMRVADQYEGGPLKAIDAFLARQPRRYEVDRRLCDYFGRNVTWNVNGFLRRLS